ncbi:hypothetical protein D7V32_02105 [Acinetobacter tianfuensis]|uniref:Lipoprotein n=2 Tax=Acinetobacter tianfuensis TaxID=2419603 RepID=A0A3A8EIW0_9GAMM|nr:hypothetical protein D7V32_02105 [Acinetobacter tianfuensis]
MKSFVIALMLCLSTILTGCSSIPEACTSYWKQIEQLSKQMGMSDMQIENNKIAFENKIKAMPKQEAVQSCTAKSSFLNLAKK